MAFFPSPLLRRFLVTAMTAALACALPGAAGASVTKIYSDPTPGPALPVGGVALAPDGSLWVTNPNRQRIAKIDSSGTLLQAVGTAGSGPGQFNSPSGIATDGAGNVYVADSGNGRVQKFDPSGTFLASIGAGILSNPRAMAVDAAGGVFVLQGDSFTEQVHRFSSTGTDLGSFGSGPFSAVAVSGSRVLLADSSDRVTVFGTDGSGPSTSFAAPAADTLPGLSAIATDAAGNVYTGNGQGIAKFAPDGTPLSSIRTSTPSGAFGGPPSFSADGGLAVDSAANVYAAARGGSMGLFKVDVHVPNLSNFAFLARSLTGDPVTFDASKAYVEFGSIVRYEWDLDGDGSFETDGGPSSTVDHVYTTPGVRSVSLRVTTSSGDSGVRAIPWSVGLRPPAGPLGASINAAAIYTNSPNVQLSLVWPAYVTTATISNDGGFGNSSDRAIAATVPWKLVESGEERLPKTVYVRFSGLQSSACSTGICPNTYQDDIILDQTPPLVSGVTGATSGARRGDAIAAKKAPKVRTTLVIKASDKTSGVSKLQYAVKTKKPSPVQSYRSKITVTGTKPAFVRVQDRAGNFSRWSSIKYPKPKPRK